MSKVGSHDPFGHLKHKIWPKKGSGVKLAICLPTTKSQESPQFLCVQMACNRLLESFRRGLQLCFKPISIEGLHVKLWGPKSQEFQLWEFRDSHLGVLGQNPIWMWASWRGTKYTINGKVVNPSLPMVSPNTKSVLVMH
jgi:hypothetical protein